MNERKVAILCMNSSEARKAWAKCYQEHRHLAMTFNMSQRWLTCRVDGVTTTYQCYSCDLTALRGVQLDEVRLYGSVRQHSKFPAVIDYLRLHTTKIGEF